MRNVWVVAMNTFREAVRDRVLYNLVFFALLMIGAAEFKVPALSPALAILPLYMLLLGMLAVGIGWVVAALQVYLRDTAHFVTVILTVWFWLTPIFVFENQVPARLRPVMLYANPLTRLVVAYRKVLLATEIPSWRDAGALAAVSVAVFFLGGLVFRHLKRGFADVL
jgi:ABC-type polysaccharide/polyol phosphate export permease